MQREIALKIQEVANDYAGDYEVEIYEEYSGRGMFGRTTTGITGITPTQLCQLVINYASEFCMYDEDGGGFVESMFEIDQLRSDNLGLDMIIY